MFLVPANTTIQVPTPRGERGWFYWSGWRPYVTREDKIYEKEEVWDIVAVQNGREGIPAWARHNILNYNRVVITREGKYAMVNRLDIQYLD